MSNTITIRLPTGMKDRLVQRAQTEGTQPNPWIVRVLERELKSHPDDMLRFAGCMSGPSDLSTNRKYRQIWGKK